MDGILFDRLLGSTGEVLFKGRLRRGRFLVGIWPRLSVISAWSRRIFLVACKRLVVIVGNSRHRRRHTSLRWTSLCARIGAHFFPSREDAGWGGEYRRWTRYWPLVVDRTWTILWGSSAGAPWLAQKHCHLVEFPIQDRGGQQTRRPCCVLKNNWMCCPAESIIQSWSRHVPSMIDVWCKHDQVI